MRTRSRLVSAALAIGLLGAVVPGPAVLSAEAARCLTAAVPKPITSGQTSSSQAQVRWAAGANVAKYRLHWSPAPFGKWPGFNPYTPWYGRTARLAAVNLPAVGSGDRFMNVAYGNPVFAQLQVNNGCNTTVRQSTYVPVWPKPRSPGSAATGDALAIGSYNVEGMPTYSGNTTKVTNIAGNIASKKLDVVMLQEASGTTAEDIATRLDRAYGQSDWAVVKSGKTRLVAQQIIYRSGKFAEADSGLLGQAKDSSASTPLLTPWARLEPVGPPNPKSRGIFVVSVHLEDFGGTIPARKLAAHNAAAALLRGIAANNPAPTNLPVVVAGDLKGNFNAYCDEKSSPKCVGEGQPTFVRAGYYDAQGAVSKVGIAYGTVNKHVANQPANLSGFGGRADYIVLKGFAGSARYEVVKRGWGNGSAAYQSDHNLITANVFIPFAP